MKKLVFIISFLIVGFLSKAQQLIPDSIAQKPVTIQLKGKHLSFIWSLLPSKGTTEATNLVIQIRRQVTGASFDTAQLFTVTVSYAMVANVYFTIGSQQERLSADDNAEMKAALIPQLYVPQYMDLLQAISNIGALNKAQTEAIRKEGINQIMAIQVQ